MSERDSSAASPCARKQALDNVETLCYKYLADTTYTLSLPDLLVLKDALPKIDKPSVWEAVSEQALPGLLSIYITSIRRSSPLLEPCSATEADLQQSVRASLSEALRGISDAQRTLRLALAILRSQSMRCYSVLMADAAASLSRQPSERTEDAAAHLTFDMDAVAALIARAIDGEVEADAASRAELLFALATELNASSLLEHWARLVLTLASCQDGEHAMELAASCLQCFCGSWGAIISCLDPGCAHRLLAASPCLSYLITSQLVALCAALDGGTVYGMPEAPGRALFTAALALPTKWDITPMDQVLSLCMDTLGVLPEAMKRQLQQAGDLVAGATPAALPSGAAAATNVPAAASTPKTAGLLAAGGPAHGASAPAAAVVAAADAPAAELMAGTDGLRAASDEGQEAGQERVTALQQPMGSAAGSPAASEVSQASTCNGTLPPLLLDPAVCLEISLRLTTALCSAFARRVGSALARQGGGVDAGSHVAEFQLRLARSASWAPFFYSIYYALRLAGELLRDAPSAAFRLRRRGLRDSGSGCWGGASAAAAPCAPGSALSPVERWWEGAVAMGGALAVTAKLMNGGKVVLFDDVDSSTLFSGYFTVLERVTSGETVDPPAEPSESVAAALSAGFLPCLERLLRAALPLKCEWVLGWEDGWDAAWAQMLLFADAAQVAAVIDAAVEGLRVAVAAAGTSSGSKDGGARNSFCLQRAGNAAARLDGSRALDWLLILSDGPSSRLGEPETPSSTCGASSFAPSAPSASCDSILPRLGESLSLIATRLLPELSRAMLGGLLPACHCGDVHPSVAYFHLEWQLYWVPTLAAALAVESAPTPAAADGSAGGGVAGSNCGGGVPGVVGAGGSPSPRVHRWRQLLLLELRLPGLLGAALGLLTCKKGTEEVSEWVLGLRESLRKALRALAALVPAELARVVAAADRAEAAAAGRAAADGRGPASGAAAAVLTPPPSSGLLRRALGPGGPLEDAELLAAVEAACAGRGSGAGAGRSGLPSWLKQLLLGARMLSLQG